MSVRVERAKSPILSVEVQGTHNRLLSFPEVDGTLSVRLTSSAYVVNLTPEDLVAWCKATIELCEQQK